MRPADAARPSERCPVVVLGLGNILLRDEGIGVRVVEALEELELPEGIEVVDGGTFGLDLLDDLADRQKVIVIDAVDADYPPGTVLRFDADKLAGPAQQQVSLHDMGLVDVLAITRLLGCAPKQVVIIGVVPRLLEEGLTLSEELSAVVPEVIRRVLEEVAQGC
jgi:hydrogenase maturation protease